MFLQSRVVCEKTQNINSELTEQMMIIKIRLRPPRPLTVRLTKHDEAGVCVRGAQWILGRAAEHGTVELSRNSLQNEFPAVVLLSAVQQKSAHLGPSEHGLREDLSLWTETNTEKNTDFISEAFPVKLSVLYLW